MARSETDVVRLTVSEIRVESPQIKTILLDNAAGRFATHRAGQHAKLCVVVDGREHWKSFTISSSPEQADVVTFTVKRNPRGTVSRWLQEQLAVGDLLPVIGPKGHFFLEPAQHVEPVVWIAAGIGITPILSMLRCLVDRDPGRPCRLIYCARHADDLFFASELQDIQGRMPNLNISISLTQPPPDWTGLTGRLLADVTLKPGVTMGEFGETRGLEAVFHGCEFRYFLCCPGDLNPRLREVLQHAGVPPDRIHCEQFFKSDKFPTA